ncbi:MAG: FtsX-like permease family protein [Nocardioidaceae bacterium]|nr:FtsX-like permease family protein [Nocardioidaceae bacterium]
MRMLLAGLWTRRGMSAAVFLISVIAFTASTLGPLYGRASAEHLLDTRIDERAPYTTGLSSEVQAVGLGDLEAPRQGPFVAPPVDELVATARRAYSDPSSRRSWGPSTAWADDDGGQLIYRTLQFTVPLYWRAGMCDLAAVTGTCPRAKNEVLMQATMADTLHLEAGDTFTLRYFDSYFVPSKSLVGRDLREVQKRRDVRFRLTGTYTVPDPDSPAWFDLSRFTGFDNLVPPPTTGSGGALRTPALLVSPQSLVSQNVRAGVDRPMRTSADDLADLSDVQRAAAAFKAKAIDRAAGNDVEVLPDLDVGSVFAQVRSERTQLSRVMVAALTPLVVLCLLLLFALVSAAAQVRRPQVALAKLRGHSRLQVLWFAVSEPFVVLAVAVPVAVAAAYVTVRVVAHGWLHPGIPVGFDAFTVLSLVVVVGASLLASGLAAMAVIREPLSVALAAGVRPRSSTRAGLVLRSGVVAVAVVAVANLVASGDQSSQLLALLTPTFIALAVAVGGALLLRLLSRGWLARTAERGSVPAYLASRRLARRQDLANLMVPLLLAVAVLTFASSATATSDDWRVSRADTEVGAARSFVTTASPGRLLQVTRQVDPDGRYLMATAVNDEGDDMRRSVFVDGDRLARVAAWDPSWSDQPIEDLQRRLVLDERKRITFTGRDLAVTVRDVALRSATRSGAYLQVQYVDDAGEQRDQLVGRIRNGAGPQVLRTPIEHCRGTCFLEQLYVTGDAVSVTDLEGRMTIASAALDGRDVDWRLTDPGAWRPARPFAVSLVDPPVLVRAGADGLQMRVYLGALPPGKGPQNGAVSGFARVTPSSTPDVAPVLVADGTRTQTARRSGSGIAIEYPASDVVGKGLNGQDTPMRVVDTVRSLPVVGTEGELADLETSLVEFEPPVGALGETRLWVAEGTPDSVLAQVRSKGIGLTNGQTRAATLHALRTDAFSLGLRLFLFVGIATLLLAVFGVLASAVLQSRWRSYEVASLRVVGVSQRALVRGSVLEYVVLLGVAVLLGVLSAYLALRLVLPSISLGTAAEHEPVPVYTTHWLIVLGVGAGLFVLAVGIAVLVSRRITRRGRPSTLRWAEQG